LANVHGFFTLKRGVFLLQRKVVFPYLKVRVASARRTDAFTLPTGRLDAPKPPQPKTNGSPNRPRAVNASTGNKGLEAAIDVRVADSIMAISGDDESG
jgi:hypothetical protein